MSTPVGATLELFQFERFRATGYRLPATLHLTHLTIHSQIIKYVICLQASHSCGGCTDSQEISLIL